MTQRLSILFYLKKSKPNKKGQVPIYVRMTIDGKRSELASGYRIKPEQWNQDRVRANGKSQEASAINEGLNLLQTKIQRQYNIMDSEDQFITPSELTNQVSGKSQMRYTICEIFDQHNKDMELKIGVDYTKATLIKYKGTKNKLKNFIAYKYGKADMSLEEINHNFVTSFDLHLKTQENNGHNSASKHLTRLKKIIRIAQANDWMSNKPFRNYKITKKETNRAYLNSQELKKLMEKEFENERLAKVRDAFLFSCYTGLAHIDLAKLTAKDISTDINGNKMLIIFRQKTNSRSPIPLLTPALAIIKKYSNCIETEIRGTLLPINSNQRMNEYLKEIAALCGINKPLTTHIARHTFASTIALENGIPIESIKKMLGHSKISTTEIYTKVNDSKIMKEMKELDEKLAGQNQPKTVAS